MRGGGRRTDILSVGCACVRSCAAQGGLCLGRPRGSGFGLRRAIRLLFLRVRGLRANVRQLAENHLPAALWTVSDRATPPTEGLQYRGDLRSADARRQFPVHQRARIPVRGGTSPQAFRRRTHRFWGNGSGVSGSAYRIGEDGRPENPSSGAGRWKPGNRAVSARVAVDRPIAASARGGGPARRQLAARLTLLALLSLGMATWWTQAWQ
jgi:hypothetical protein